MKRIIVIVLMFPGFLFLSCKDDITNPPSSNEFLVPELVAINKDLTFTMGNSWGNPVEVNEIPAHTVKLSPYYIGKYEVTNEEYFCFVKDNGYKDSSFWSPDAWEKLKEQKRERPVHWDSSDTPWLNYEYSNTAKKPICNISWSEAEAYCNWLSKKTGDSYSLPTEAQWERAARGPDPGRRFPWGDVNDFSKYNDVGFFSQSKLLKEVGSYPEGKSYDGCFDMAGNVIEYCLDWYDLPDNSYYNWCYEQGIVQDPQGSSSGKDKSIRGVQNMLSSEYEIAREITTTRRFLYVLYSGSGQLQLTPASSVGFRVIKN